VVTDFGIAKVSDKLTTKKSTHADARMGTLSYMSPEQIRKAKEVTARSDVFSLGAMFYELATRTIAFDGGSDFDVMEKIVHGRFEPPERKVDGLAPRIAGAINRSLQPDPEKRFASCEDFAPRCRAARRSRCCRRRPERSARPRRPRSRALRGARS